MEQTVGEGLELPRIETAMAEEVPGALVAHLHHGASEWLVRMLRPEFVDAGSARDFIALRGAVEGNDALFEGWLVNGSPVQVIVTHERVHVRTVLPVPDSTAAAGPRIAAAVALAAKLFQLPRDPAEDDWPPRDLGPFTFAAQTTEDPSDWYQTCLIVTDGVGVKYSFLKYLQLTSPPKGGSALRIVRPWFPQTELAPR